jgi:uncharacterized protein YjbJ (UPF0337 family)
VSPARRGFAGRGRAAAAGTASATARGSAARARLDLARTTEASRRASSRSHRPVRSRHGPRGGTRSITAATVSEEDAMERNQFEGIWKRAKGEVKRTFGKLTDDDVMEAEGNYDKLVGKIQQRYGESKEDAAKKFNEFLDGVGSRAASKPRGPAVPPEKEQI